MHEENEIRENKIKEHKRNLILESHENLKAMYEKKKKDIELHSNNLRKQSISKNESKNKLYKQLNKIIKENSIKEYENGTLMATLKDLNEKYKLKLDFRIPKVLHIENDTKTNL